MGLIANFAVFTS